MKLKVIFIRNDKNLSNAIHARLLLTSIKLFTYVCQQEIDNPHIFQNMIPV